MICPSCRATNDEAAETCFQCGMGLRVLTKGSVVAGRYEIQQVLGRGGMGLVFKAWDRALEETVALKVLRGPAAASPDAATRFRHEIKLARKVRHRNVCGIHEYGQEGPLQYIAMEFVEGVDLRKVLQERGVLPADEAFDVAIQLTRGIQAIHMEGIVHRDLKTANIMRDRSGVVRLMDFGIAKRFEGESVTQVTGIGTAVGTPEYMSPEQVRGEPLDARSDLYALGIVIYELFTGRRPFEGDTPLAMLMKHLQAPPPLEGPGAERLPRPLIPVLRRVLAKDREERFASAAELQQALRAARAEVFPGRFAASGAVPQAEEATLPRVGAGGTTARSPITRPFPASTFPPVANVAAETNVIPAPAGAHVEPAPARAGRRALFAGGLVVVAVAALVGTAQLMGWRLGLRSPQPTFAPSPVAGPASPASPEPSEAAPTVAPAPTPTASAASGPVPPPDTVPTGPTPPPAIDLARLDRLSERDPEAALDAALGIARVNPSLPGIHERVARYRSALVGRLVASGQAALRRAGVAESSEVYEEALRYFEKAITIDALDEAAQRGQTEALRALQSLRSRSGAVRFVQSETVFTPPPSPGPPPGLGPLPSGVVAKPANPPAPRAQLVIEMIPSQLRAKDEYTLRYSLFNQSATPLTIGSVSIRNRVGGAATGGAIEPRTRTASPQTRTLLVETGGTWRHDPTTQWTSTFTVVIEDGSVYVATLRAGD